MLVLLILAVVWAAVLLPPLVRSRRDGRPDNSVVSFRAQLSTLERATPGTSLKLSDGATEPSSRTVVAPAPRVAAAPRLPSNDQKRRRREVLISLLGATGFALLLLAFVGGTLITLFFLASGVSLAAYVYALRQIHVRSLERAAKVRPLVPRHVQASSSVAGSARTATS